MNGLYFQMLTEFVKDENGNYDDDQCCCCGQYDCDCDALPTVKCVVCGKEFMGKHSFSWAIHQAMCKYEKEKE